MRHLQGDSDTLPQAPLLGNMFLDDEEQLVLEGEDLQCCLNLFVLPPCWKGLIVFHDCKCIRFRFRLC